MCILDTTTLPSGAGTWTWCSAWRMCILDTTTLPSGAGTWTWCSACSRDPWSSRRPRVPASPGPCTRPAGAPGWGGRRRNGRDTRPSATTWRSEPSLDCRVRSPPGAWLSVGTSPGSSKRLLNRPWKYECVCYF